MSDIDQSMLQQLDEASKQEVVTFINQETSKAKVQSSVTDFTDMCFKKCITTINSDQLDQKEANCVNDCLNRFLDTNIKIVQILQGLQK